MTSVNIALVGDPSQPEARLLDDEWERPWEDRAKVSLKVAHHETLASLVERAFEAFGITSPQGAVPAHAVDLALRQEDEGRPRVWDMTLVDDTGRAIWTAHDLRLIPYSQLVAAQSTGAVAGNPRAIYLIVKEPVGNGLGVDWPTIVRAWEVVDALVKPLAEVGGAAAFAGAALRLIRRRVARGRTAIDANVPRWSQVGAWPYTFVRFFNTRPAWSPANLARLLGCSEADAQAILELYGYAEGDEPGHWKCEGDVPATALRAITYEALWSEIELGEDRLRNFTERVGHILETGLPPPVAEPDNEPDYPSWEEIERQERLKVRIAASGVAAGSLLVGFLLGRRRS